MRWTADCCTPDSRSESLAETRNLEFEKHTADLRGADFAFRGTPLGHSTTDPRLNEDIDFEQVAQHYEAFVHRHFTQQNMYAPLTSDVLLSNCADHDAACRLLERAIAASGLPVGPAAPPYPSGFEFVPGAELVSEEPSAEEQDNELLLVWRAVPWEHPDSYVFFVLKWLLGQASDFMEGGPGRGMHCRAVYLISAEPGIVEIETVFKLFKTTGVFGLAYKVQPEYTARLAASMLYQIATLADSVTEEELLRAKNSQALKAAINLERKLERTVEQSYNLLVPAPSPAPRLHPDP